MPLLAVPTCIMLSHTVFDQILRARRVCHRQHLCEARLELGIHSIQRSPDALCAHCKLTALGLVILVSCSKMLAFTGSGAALAIATIATFLGRQACICIRCSNQSRRTSYKSPE